jgi:hypothetical protein
VSPKGKTYSDIQWGYPNLNERCVGENDVSCRQPLTNALLRLALAWQDNWRTKKSATHWVVLYPELTLLKRDSNILQPWTWFEYESTPNQSGQARPFYSTIYIYTVSHINGHCYSSRSQAIDRSPTFPHLEPQGMELYPWRDGDWVATTAPTKTTPLPRPFLDGLVLWSTAKLCEIMRNSHMFWIYFVATSQIKSDKENGKIMAKNSTAPFIGKTHRFAHPFTIF